MHVHIASYGMPAKKQMVIMMNRTAGVLMNLSSLPGPFGIGVFGKESLEFVDTLAAMDFHWWQVLPFNLIDSANSPYTSVSAFAGNYLYIDPRELETQNLLTKEEVQAGFCSSSPYTTDYAFAKTSRLLALKQAFLRVDSALQAQIDLFSKERAWLADFALFMAVKEANDFAPWWEWKTEYADHKSCISHKEEFAQEVAFWKFVQYEFFLQWNAVKEYANQKGVGIIGDMPIYVAQDSADVWSNLAFFCMDEKTLKPQKVAGVPPDYFSADGQLWGNPLYNWKAMERDHFQWWVDRIGTALQTYDYVRIDHFRGFASYWAVPVGALTAKEGEWEDGPGMKLFDAVAKAFDHPAIIAEDLGVFGEDVTKLLTDTDFPGMRVIQFGFDPAEDSTHLPHNYPANCMAYVGTHDNNTLLGWLWEATPAQRKYALRYCGFEGKDWGEGGYQSASCRKIIETVWRSSANTAIISFQDLCGFGSDARMNIPGVPENNWCFRTTKETIGKVDQAYYKEINRLYRRDRDYIEKV